MLAAPIVADTGWSLAWVVGRAVARPVDGRRRLAVGRPRHCAARRPSGAGGKRGPARDRPRSALALAHSLPAFLAAWLVIGLGMGAGLYDPAFATLGRLYGESGRSAITTLTLFGGFASTVCWPLSAFLDAHLGWRGACLVYAGFQLAVALPIYLFVLPREPRRPPAGTGRRRRRRSAGARRTADRGMFLLLATTITLASVISTVMSVHLLTVLQAKGLALAAAVGLGALVGPSQVTARTIEMADRALSSSDLDEARRNIAGHGGPGGAVGWRPVITLRSCSTARASAWKASRGERCRSRFSARSVTPSSWAASPCRA